MATTITYHSIKIGSGNRFKEKNFEADIEHYLLNEGGYIKGDQSTYDKKRAIDMPVLLQFIQDTQPKVWQRYVNLYGDKSADQLYKVFQADVAHYGLVHVLRNGIKDRGSGLGGQKHYGRWRKSRKRPRRN